MSEIIIKMPDGAPSIRILSLPRGVTKLTKVASTGRYSVAMAEDGTLYSVQALHQIQIREWWQAEPNMLICLARLKVIPKGFVEKTKAERQVRNNRHSLRWNLGELDSLFKKLDMKIPKEVQKSIDKLKKHAESPIKK